MLFKIKERSKELLKINHLKFKKKLKKRKRKKEKTKYLIWLHGKFSTKTHSAERKVTKKHLPLFKREQSPLLP